jgi:hypothetical protein
VKIYLNRNTIFGPWGGGAKFINSLHEFQRKLNYQIVSLEQNPDVIFIAGMDRDGSHISLEEAVEYKRHFKDVKLVFRINENDARKNTFHVDQRILQHLPKIDKVVYVSTWLSDYFKSRGALNTNNKVILNGVDRSVFKPSNKFENGKINVMTCHWSDNYLKGQDYVEFMDDFVATSDEFTFTYIGRTKANLKHSSLVQPLFGKFLADEIAKYDLCINASRFDPGPNSVIEPICCGVPTYVHVDGGGAVEFAGEDHTFASFDDLRSILKNKKYSLNKDSFLDWESSIKSYINFMRE